MKSKDLLLDQSAYETEDGTTETEIPTLEPNERYSFLLKSKEKQRITTYNVQSSDEENMFPAPFGIITFNIAVNTQEDWVNGFNTRISSSKFIAIINSFNYNNRVVSTDTSVNARRRAPVAQVYTYEQGGTWWIKADYHGFAHTTGNTTAGQWEINLMVFDKNFARVFNKVENFGTTDTQNPKVNRVASAPIIP